MFARSDLGSLETPPPPHQNRAIGAVMLIVCVTVLVILAASTDAAIFIPYNATHAVTQTYEAAHPQTHTPTPIAPAAPTRSRPRLFPTPNQPDPNVQQVRHGGSSADRSEVRRASEGIAARADSI